MKALLKKERKVGVWMDDVPVPEPESHEVLIKTKKTSICGTDVHIYQWDEWAQKTIPTPMVIGHEFVGEVVALGSHVKGVKIGERVCGEGHITCNVCPNCRMGKKHICMNTIGLGVHRHGCFAEYFTLPAQNLFPLSETISDELGAIFDPYGNAVHTALSFPLTGEDVLITGAGPIGAMAAAIARHAGARRVVITDLNEYRLNLARTMGATDVINVSKIPLEEAMKAMGLTTGFTVGLEMSGSPRGFQSMLQAMRHGGKVALLGILPPSCQIDWDLVIFKMLTLKGIYGREIFDTWYKMAALLESGLPLQSVITHHYSVDEFEEGFQKMISGQSGKVILHWDR